MSDIAHNFRRLPSEEPSLVGDSYELIADPAFTIQDATPYGGGYCVGVDNQDGTFTGYQSVPDLEAAMQHCLNIHAERQTQTKQQPVTIIKRVLFFSPAGTEPKVSVQVEVPGKPKITKRLSSCIHFDIGGRSFIADKASWMARKENGFIYALESGVHGV